MYFDWEKWDLSPLIPQNLLVGSAINYIALLSVAQRVCEFEVFTTNTLGEIGVKFFTSGRRLKKKLIQLKVFKENNSLGGFAQTNNNNNNRQH